jgi:hypothetical protein
MITVLLLIFGVWAVCKISNAIRSRESEYNAEEIQRANRMVEHALKYPPRFKPLNKSTN